MGRSVGGPGSPSGVHRSSPTPKDRDFALLLGPVVDTELADDFDWESARALAELHTRLRPGDLLGGPPLELSQDVETGLFELTFDGLGTLTANVS